MNPNRDIPTWQIVFISFGGNYIRIDTGSVKNRSESYVRVAGTDVKRKEY